jgi:hypothetical protein
MKTKCFLLTVLLVSSLNVLAQHPLVGTWEMVSLEFTDFDGKKISLVPATAREIKIITPTHYMLIAQDVIGDSLVFNRSHAGTVKFDGDIYIESPVIASWENHKPLSRPFNWKVEGDKFIQWGIITREDGKTATLHELVFQRLKGNASYLQNPSNGTWDQLSSNYTLANGKKESHTRETATRFQIITPTHWMRISHRQNKFESAMGGAYSMAGNKVYPVIEFASFPVSTDGKMEFTQRIEGDKLFISGVSLLNNGNKFTWNDEFQRVTPDLIK